MRKIRFMSVQKKVPVSISVTEEQAEFLKTIPDRSEVFQRFIDGLIVTRGLAGVEKTDALIGHELAESYVKKWLSDINDDTAEIYQEQMSTGLELASWWWKNSHDWSTQLFGDKVSKEASEFLERIRNLEGERVNDAVQTNITPEDLQIVRLIFNQIRDLYARAFQKRWSKYPGHGWDTGISLNGKVVKTITPP